MSGDHNKSIQLLDLLGNTNRIVSKRTWNDIGAESLSGVLNSSFALPRSNDDILDDILYDNITRE